ncbi:hypothetical protein [Methylobacterium brachythecii]|uniref:Uncharacterized protein n=1 Tax=Methylobacterium brachythecii TaxID=1176177 RepID=A0A7W6ALG2_9HYPH|nr:hypothetical protein [Methylobacterium brachythecii]MBB3904766.1 hypothetical protein [Methylobacterium brachythecii]GLS45558.1 hypothetical protein GCM10007884_35490 [Methylobacterium brachythecii]
MQSATTTIEAAAKAISSILDALERDPTDPAAVALRAALRRKGTEIAEAGDGITLQNVHELVCGVGDNRNERRAAELDAAWKGMPQWSSDAA